MSDPPPAIAPIYPMSHVNQAIPLHEGFVELAQEGRKATGTAKFEFRWLRSPSVHVALEDTSQVGSSELLPIGGGRAMLTLPEAIAPASVAFYDHSIHYGPHGVSCRLGGSLDEGLSFGGGVALHHVLFHLVNFHALLEQPIEDEQHSWMGRAVARFGDWQITVDTVGNYKNLHEELRHGGGYAITHAACLERADGSMFSVDEARSVLECLFWFFTFARGFFAPALLPVGFDVDGNRVWKEWQAFRADEWKGCQSWFSDRQYVSHNLESALSGFWKRWNDPVWNGGQEHAPLKLAIHWYASANTDEGGLEGSIILVQTGLELLAWVLLVEDTKMWGKSKFDSVNAAGKFEALLNHIRITLMIPSQLTNLSTLAVAQGWANGPEAIAGLRNTIVHPKRRAATAGVSFEARYELLELAIWYMELALLHICEYQGRYVNRISEKKLGGVTEPIPWVSTSKP